MNFRAADNRVIATVALLSLALLSLALPCAARETKKDRDDAKPSKGEKDKEKKEKEKENDKDKEQPLTWHQKLVPGPAVQLRIKRDTGKILIYDGTFTRTQQGANSYVETAAFYLTVLCADRREEMINGRNRILDLLAIRRTFTDRTREERLENGKVIKRAEPNTEDLISFGPNYEPIGALRCHAFDAQNCPAFRTEQLMELKDGRQLRGRVLSEDDVKVAFLTDTDKVDLPRAEIARISLIPQPHVCLDETPNYLFPPLPEQKKSPGQTWRFRIPLIIPLQQGIPARILPTQFMAIVDCRLCEVRIAGASQTAVIEYQISGRFDSSADEFVARFPVGFKDDNTIVHKIAGTGVLTLDIEKGRILEKSETFHFSFYGSGNVEQGPGKPMKTQENKMELSSTYQIKLMLPGMRLKNSVVVPNYD